MSGGFTWTDDQQVALAAEGDLVLTASAGTGKTTILVEKFTRRLLSLISEMPPQDLDRPATSPLRKMVAITFTELAAAQLKNEIRLKLVALYSGDVAGDGMDQTIVFPPEKKDYLLRLMRELDGAYIGTIHSFCSRLLRENFIEAGLSPKFGILADEDADELQAETADDACAESSLRTWRR